MSTGATLSTRPKRAIAGRVNDFNKAPWNVCELRPTKHGFDLYFGTRRDTYRAPYSSPSTLMVRRALRDFRHANRAKGLRFFLDLPVSSSALELALRRLRLNHREDVKAFWNERVQDLAAH